MDMIKVREGFVLRKLPDMNLVLPKGAMVKDYHNAVVLNDTAAFLFAQLETGSTAEGCAKALTEEYDISYERAYAAAERTIADLQEAGLLESGDL